MPDYRIFTFTPENHIKGAAAIVVCENDSEAINEAQKLPDGYDLEIREGP